MAFINPLFLFGLLAATIPIAVHLVRRTRASRIQFPSLMFIRQIEQKTIRKRKLRNLLLLVLRCLALLLLAFAFSRPYFAGSNRQLASPAGAGVILLDVSYSMRYPGVFERARQAARDVAASTASGDRLALAVFSSHCEVLRQLNQDKAELRTLIDQSGPGLGSTDYNQALEAANSLLEEAGSTERKIYLISDFHPPGWDRTSRPPKLSRAVALIPIDVGDPRPRNLAVLDVKAQPEVYAQKYAGKVIATLTSSAGAQSVTQPAEPAVDATVELKLNDLTVERRQVHLEPGLTANVEFSGFNVPEGSNRATVELSGDDFPVDNSYYFTINRTPPIRVLSIETAGRGRSESFFLQQSLLSTDSSPYELAVKTQGSINPLDLDQYRVIIVNDAGISQELAAALKGFAARGGGLVIAAGKHTDAAEFNKMLGNIAPARVGDVAQARGGYGLISDVNLDHPLFSPFKKGGHLAPIRVYAYHRLEPAERASALATLDDGSPLIVEGLAGAGKVLLVGTTLDNAWTDLPITPMFLPLIHQMLDYLVGRGTAPAYKIGQAIVAPQSTDGSVPQIQDPRGGAAEVTSSKEGAPTATANEPGFYRLKYQDRIDYVAVNLDTRESDLSRLDLAEFTAAVTADRKGEQSQAEDTRLLTPADIESRQRLWIPLLLISLALFVTEAILARRIRIARLVG